MKKSLRLAVNLRLRQNLAALALPYLAGVPLAAKPVTITTEFSHFTAA